MDIIWYYTIGNIVIIQVIVGISGELLLLLMGLLNTSTIVNQPCVDGLYNCTDP